MFRLRPVLGQGTVLDVPGRRWGGSQIRPTIAFTLYTMIFITIWPTIQTNRMLVARCLLSVFNRDALVLA